MTNKTTIFHITTKPVWQKALVAKTYSQSTILQTFDEVGFIHASFPSQLAQTAKLHYADCQDELLLLEMSIENLQEAGLEVKLETSRNGELFPHIYAPIPTELIQKVMPYQVGN